MFQFIIIYLFGDEGRSIATGLRALTFVEDFRFTGLKLRFKSVNDTVPSRKGLSSSWLSVNDTPLFKNEIKQQNNNRVELDGVTTGVTECRLCDLMTV